MTTERNDQTVVTQEPAAAAPPPEPTAPVVTQEPAAAAPPAQPTAPVQQTLRTDSSRVSRSSPGGSEMIRRVVVLVFGLIQIVIALRVVFLLLDARTSNAIVSGILDISKIFVAPFNGILNVDYFAKSGSVLDVTAIVAFVGWTIIELIVIWAVGIFRREPA